MRRHETETKEVTETKTTTKLVECTCDLCGTPGGPWGGDDRWERRYANNNNMGDYISVCICFEQGNSYPEGGHSTTQYYDVCPECFESKIKPLFPNPPNEKESDW